MTLPAPTRAISTRIRHRTCTCGKRGWPTKHDADQIVVNAKILRSLHGNNRRQEQRSYRCPTNASLWHVTSQEERTYGANYSPDDDEAAREYIESLLLADGHRDNEPAWTHLLTAPYAAQTDALLSRIHQDGLKVGADSKAHLVKRLRQVKNGSSRHLYNVEVAEHKEWVLNWTRFQAAIVTRKAQAKKAVREINIKASATDAHQVNIHHRDIVARLALAIAKHREETLDPTPADRALWASLDEVCVPYRGGEAPLSELLNNGAWGDRALTPRRSS